MVHFAVALARVPIARLEQRAARVNRDEQRSPRHQILVIEIAGVKPGRPAADRGRLAFGGATPMLPKNGWRGISIPGAKRADHSGSRSSGMILVRA